MPYEMPAAADKARYVRRKFDEIARRYDLFNDLITQGQHRWWKRRLVRRVSLAPGARVLDLCCGTGDIARRWQQRLGSAGEVVALDFSTGMLGIARHRLRPGSGLARAIVLGGDAMHLPFPDATFDAVSVGYGLRNVNDLAGCLREIHRVLRPGGTLASLDVGKVRNRWLRPLVNLYFFYVVPWIGRRLQPGQDMFTYLPQSSVDYPEQHALAALMQAQGFRETAVVEYVFGASALHFARK